jgi:hypothetical protein
MTENGMESRTLLVCFSLCAERRSDGERLVDRREHLPHNEFVEAAAVTVEPPREKEVAAATTAQVLDQCDNYLSRENTS